MMVIEDCIYSMLVVHRLHEFSVMHGGLYCTRASTSMIPGRKLEGRVTLSKFLWLTPRPPGLFREQRLLQLLRQERDRPLCTPRESRLWIGASLPESCRSILSACKIRSPLFE